VKKEGAAAVAASPVVERVVVERVTLQTEPAYPTLEGFEAPTLSYDRAPAYCILFPQGVCLWLLRLPGLVTV
jgi:hypothetical protein